MRYLCLLVAASLFPVGVTAAQNINVDVGNLNGVPSPSYAAGAAQPGPWNQVNRGLLGAAQALPLDAAGNACTATLTLVNGQAIDFNFDNAGTTGDDQLLMDDAQDAGGTGATNTWMFSGLAAARYKVFTYAWAPDSAAYIDSVTCGIIDPPQNCGGAWPGAQTQGITYTVHTVDVPTNGSISIVIATVSGFSTVNGFQIKIDSTPSTTFCGGDGVGTSCLACGNNGAAGRGCANSSFAAGTQLGSTGNASVGADTLALVATDMTGPGLFFQANGVAASPIAFGDGQLCAAVGILRLGVVFPAAGSATYPGGLTPNPITVGGGPILAGNTKHYQVWYRDAAAFCTVSTFNTSNGISLVWTP